MPYKTEKLKIPRSLDYRVKVSEAEKLEIKNLFKEGLPIREIARRFEKVCSRRTIQYLIFPERLVENKLRRAERGGWKQYYDKNKHAAYMKKHRATKHKRLS